MYPHPIIYLKWMYFQIQIFFLILERWYSFYTILDNIICSETDNYSQINEIYKGSK